MPWKGFGKQEGGWKGRKGGIYRGGVVNGGKVDLRAGDLDFPVTLGMRMYSFVLW